MRKIIVGVMGPGAATPKDLERAYELGKLIAQENWVLLSGGRNAGVMDMVSKGAKSAGGLVIGIIPGGDNKNTSNSVDIAIVTGMGGARNMINVLSSDVVIACGMGAGTASEVAHAIKANKNVILLTDDAEANTFFQKLGKGKVTLAKNPQEAILTAKKIINS